MISITELTQTCLACPSQWDAMADDGTELYIRYRWGTLAVRQKPASPIDNRSRWAWHTIFDKQVGDGGLDGIMATSELLDHIAPVAQLAPNAVVSSMEWADAETIEKRFNEIFGNGE